jgi:hypothetical protein
MKQFYTRLLLFLLLPLLPATAFAQGFGLPPGFELKKFQANEDQAIWFLQYDSAYQFVAAFDHISAPKDFICYPDKKGWKVVVGTVDSSGFTNPVFYQVDAKNVVTVARKKYDTIQVANMGRGLYNAKQALVKINNKVTGWRKFVKINTDQTVVVWAFPDIDAAGNIWYGPECAWYFNPDGRTLSTSKIINKAPMMAGKAGTTLNLSCPTDKMPTVGTIWLAHKYKLTYNDVNVSYKTGTSTLHYNVAEKTYAWDHTAN